MLPLTPLQQGLLFHAGAARGPGDDVYAVQLEITVSGPLDPHRLGAAVQTVVGRHPQLAAGFCERFGEPVQILVADPVAPWRYVDLDTGGDVDSVQAEVGERVEALCAAERAAVCDLAGQPAFRAVLVRIAADRHRLVLTNHHIVLRWVVVADPAARDLRRLLPAAVGGGGALPEVCELAGRSRPGGGPGGLG